RSRQLVAVAWFQPAPKSTLPPYTTLFRSGDLVPQQGPDRPVDVPDGQAELDRLLVLDRLRAERDQRLVERLLEPVVLGPHAAPRDRKSTRLNSSHGSISYAVFCLTQNNRV